LGIECGTDGCGSDCGTCGGLERPGMTPLATTCLLGSGRCIAGADETSSIKSDWFSKDSDMPTTGLATTGMGCKGRYCDQARLHLLGIMVAYGYLDYSGWISDNTGKRYAWNEETVDQVADCPKGQVITRIECRGRYCDDLRLECAAPVSWVVDPLGKPWVGKNWFSEEGSARQDCPTGFAMVGLECQVGKTLFEDGCITNCHDYCDNKKIRCRQITPSAVGYANLGTAEADEVAAATAPSVWCDSQCKLRQATMQAIVSYAVAPRTSCVFTLSMLFWLA